MSSITKRILTAGLAVALLAPASFAQADDDKSDIVDTAVAAG